MMNSFKVEFQNGDHFVTGFNGSFYEAKTYYLNKYFNFSIEGDIMVKCINVLEVKQNE